MQFQAYYCVLWKGLATAASGNVCVQEDEDDENGKEDDESEEELMEQMNTKKDEEEAEQEPSDDDKDEGEGHDRGVFTPEDSLTLPL